jgi:uncharacterized protein (TIGR02246 family)
MRLRAQYLVISLLATCSLLASAQQPQDRAAIQTIVSDQQEAWNRGDAKAFSAHFARDGSFTNVVGMQTYGIAPFQKQHEYIFSTIYKGSHNEFTIGKLRFIRPDVAVADVDSVLSKTVSVPPGLARWPDGALHTKLQLVLSKENGAWQIDAFHNVAISPPQPGGPPM